MKDHQMLNAGNDERSHYSKLLSKKKGCIDAIFKNKKARIPLDPKTVNRICRLSTRFPEEEVLFVFYKDVDPPNSTYKRPQQYLPVIEESKDEDNQLLIPSNKPKCLDCCDGCNTDLKTFVQISYLLFNILLIAFGLALIAFRFKVFSMFPTFFFSTFLLMNGILIVGLFTTGFTGIYNYYYRKTKISLMTYYYAIITLIIAITIVELILLGFPNGIGKKMALFVDKELQLCLGLLIPGVVIETICLITNYYVDKFDHYADANAKLI